MKRRFKLKIIAFTVLLANTCLSIAAEKQSFSGINALSFVDSQYDKGFVGNGFLIKYNQKLYAVTVKHALMEARTPKMATVSIDGHINKWRIHPNKQSDNFIQLGRLLNADDSEKIDMNILTKDWLVFEVEKNHSTLVPLELRDSPIKKGETLTAYGCSYVNKVSCEQDEYPGVFISATEDNLRVAMANLDLSQLRGLSGSPVLDNNHRVVGIVSNLLKSESGEGLDFAPANLEYLYQVLKKLN